MDFARSWCPDLSTIKLGGKYFFWLYDYNWRFELNILDLKSEIQTERLFETELREKKAAAHAVAALRSRSLTAWSALKFP